MATQLPDRSPACDRARRRNATLRLTPRVAAALCAQWLIACGTPSDVTPESGAADLDANSAPSEPTNSTPGASTSSTPTGESTHQTEADQSHSTQPLPSSSGATSTSPNDASSTATSNPTEPSPSDDLAPPTPDIFAPEGSGIPPGSGPLGVETTCDGADDDMNGVVDDVDATGDGVCDCLRVATLGLHGEWGEGDFVKGWLGAHVTNAAVDLDGEPLSVERLEPFHILLVRDVSLNHNATLSFSAQEVNALWTWVRNGGGLMTLIGYSDPDESGNVNTLLEPFGLSYGSEQVVQGMGASVPVTQWFEHPLSAGITEIGADNGYPVVGQGTTFAGQDDYDIGKALTIGDGHVLVWGDEWVTYEDEWSSNTTYQVERFWQNSLLWLTRATQCKVNLE